EIDSIYQSFFGPPSWFGAPPFQSTEYEWIGQNKKEVLLRIIVSNINGSEQIRVIEYQDNYLGLDAGLNNIDFQVSAFPNPTSEQIKISTALPIRNYTVFNTFGTKLEKQQNLNTDDFTIDFTSFSSGVYFLILESISGTKTIRVTKN
ncbi:MAG: T9SS type A sorting domain-containing protein, partial [Bacteroidetes bacterium]|nr:T9SS type A sorting domain-containing protein [Bacteroidota bacterium]